MADSNPPNEVLTTSTTEPPASDQHPSGDAPETISSGPASTSANASDPPPGSGGAEYGGPPSPLPPPPPNRLAAEDPRFAVSDRYQSGPPSYGGGASLPHYISYPPSSYGGPSSHNSLYGGIPPPPHGYHPSHYPPRSSSYPSGSSYHLSAYSGYGSMRGVPPPHHYTTYGSGYESGPYGGHPPPPPPPPHGHGSYPPPRSSAHADDAGRMAGTGGTVETSRRHVLNGTDPTDSTNSVVVVNDAGEREPSRSPEDSTESTRVVDNTTSLKEAAAGDGGGPRPLHIAPQPASAGIHHHIPDYPRHSHPSSISVSSGITTGSNSNNNNSLNSLLNNQQLADPAEVDRLRAAAATEITPKEVRPIQTDFHFFVKEHMSTHRQLAEQEVFESIRREQGNESLTIETLDPVLVNTNLNARLMKAWEELTTEQREVYMCREEEDRRRFMEEDEIASRHCATLTARGKSPRTTYLEGRPRSTPSPPSSETNASNLATTAAAEAAAASATHASRDDDDGMYDETKQELHFEEKKDCAGDALANVASNKRPPPRNGSPNKDAPSREGSPSKRIKLEEDETIAV